MQGIKPPTAVQEYIIQLLLEMWEDNFGHILGSRNKENRLNILQKVHFCCSLN